MAPRNINTEKMIPYEFQSISVPRDKTDLPCIISTTTVGLKTGTVVVHHVILPEPGLLFGVARC